MRKKIKLATFALLVFALFFGATYAIAYGELIIVDWETGEILGTATPSPTPQNPIVRLLEPAVITQSSGTKEQHKISLRNVGHGNARNFLATVTTEKDAPFTVSFVDNSQTITTFPSSTTRAVTIEIEVDQNAASGTYILKLDYSYIDAEIKDRTGSDQITIRIDGKTTTAPSLIVTDFSVDESSITAGDNFTLSGRIKNAGAGEARNVQLIADGFKNEEINLSDSSNQIFISSLSGNGTYDFQLHMYASANIKPGSYPIDFEVKYKDTSGEDHSYAIKYFINVYGTEEVRDDTRAILSISNIDGPNHEIGVAENFAHTLSIVNNGTRAAKNIKITAVSDTEYIVPRSSSIQQIPTLEPGETETLTFNFAPTNNTKSQNYNIAFKTEYENGLLDANEMPIISTFEQYTGVNVTNPEKEEDKDDDDEKPTGSGPKIIISKYSTDPMIVQAGREFELYMTFLNSHGTKTIQNIEISLTVEDRTEDKGIVFSPVDSSNSFYIDRIAPGAEYDKVLRLYTVPDAAPRNYQIQVNSTYDDNEGNSYQATKIIGINVKQVARLDTSEIFIPSNANMGEPVYVSFNLYNKGRVKLNNLLVRVEGDFDTSNAEYFYGTFDIGYTEWYDGMFIPNVSGEQSGKLIISYEDDLGDEVVLEQDFVIMVSEPFFDSEMRGDFGMMEEMPMENQSFADKLVGFLKNRYLWIGVGVVATAAVIVVVSVIKVRKRKAWELDE